MLYDHCLFMFCFRIFTFFESTVWYMLPPGLAEGTQYKAPLPPCVLALPLPRVHPWRGLMSAVQSVSSQKEFKHGHIFFLFLYKSLYTMNTVFHFAFITKQFILEIFPKLDIKSFLIFMAIVQNFHNLLTGPLLISTKLSISINIPQEKTLVFPSFYRYLLSTYSVLCSVLNSGSIAVNLQTPVSKNLHSNWEHSKQIRKQIQIKG